MKAPEDAVPDYVRACEAMRRMAYRWQQLAIEYEHMHVLGEQRAAYLDVPVPHAALPAMAKAWEQCASEVHAFLDWTPTADPDGPAA